MAVVPDLITLLCLDPRRSTSPFGGNHRTIMISKDFTNSGDFVLSNLMQHLARREPSTHVLLVTLSHDWTNYMASAAKCGTNLRRVQAGGSFHVLNIMEKFLHNYSEGNTELDYCDLIYKEALEFIKTREAKSPEGFVSQNPVAIILDELSTLEYLGATISKIYRLVVKLDTLMRKGSQNLRQNSLCYLIFQTLGAYQTTGVDEMLQKNNLDYINANFENICDLHLCLKPLDTGHSTNVDGTIKIVDNRLPATINQVTKPQSSLMFSSTYGEIGLNRVFYYKLSDRRAKITSSALSL